jgi:5-methyltetrahydrofolate--homocysteine methyltransferase
MNPLHAEDLQAIAGANVVMGQDPNCTAWIRRFRVAPEGGAEGAAGEGARGRREGRRRARV